METIVIAGAPVSDREAYRHILAKGSARVAVDAGADLCMALGWVPDLFVGDGDSVSAETLRRLVADDVPRIMLPGDKSVSDLSAALEAASALGRGSLTVTAVTGGRTDHLLVAMGDLFAAKAPSLRVEEPGELGWILSAGGRDELVLAPAQALVSVIAGPNGAVVSLSGFRWNLSRSALEPLSGVGLSNVIAADTARVRVHTGSVFVHAPGVGSAPPVHTVPLESV